MERGIEDAVVMDQDTFKSLTSGTRTKILKLLKKRNHTLSEIAKTLGISKTTAKEHLDILVKGRLTEQVPSTNKWKYYTLTKDGRKLVGEEGPKRVVILIATFVIGFLFALYGFASPFVQPVALAEEQIGGEADSWVAKGDEATMETLEAGDVPPASAPREMETYEEETAMVGEPTAEAPNYIPMMLGIVGIAMMAMTLLLFLKGRRKKGVI